MLLLLLLFGCVCPRLGFVLGLAESPVWLGFVPDLACVVPGLAWLCSASSLVLLGFGFVHCLAWLGFVPGLAVSSAWQCPWLGLALFPGLAWLCRLFGLALSPIWLGFVTGLAWFCHWLGSAWCPWLGA